MAGNSNAGNQVPQAAREAKLWNERAHECGF